MNSAARTAGFFVLALRVVRRIRASRKPACRNSLQKATASFAPAIQENQFAAPACEASGNGACKTSSAPNTQPPGFTIRASSRKISSRYGFKLKIPFTRARSTDASARGSCSAPDRRNIMLANPSSRSEEFARLSIASLKSMPTTRPSAPIRRAAIRESNPEPHPRSITVAPAGSVAKTETLETPANPSIAVWGIVSRSPRGYPKLRANSSPTGNGCFSSGLEAALE